MLAGAADRAGTSDLRLANILRLGHNMSVDLWIEQTVRHARLVVVRLLGGPAYWQYGVDQLTALAVQGDRGRVPARATPTPTRSCATARPIAPEMWDRLHALFVAGGPENADTILHASIAVGTLPLAGRGRVCHARA